MTTETTSASKLHADVVTMQAAIQSAIKIDKAGTVTGTDDLYVKLLPEGVTLDTVKAVDSYNSRFIAGAHAAIGAEAVAAMKKHSGIDQISASVPLVGKSHYDVTVKRRSEFPGIGEGAAPVVKYAASTGKLVNGEADTSRGQLKHVRAMVAELGLAALGK
jgi:hypothetical protein